MKAIFGLGNPGQQYRKNRHNIGYMVVDEVARIWGLSFRRSFKLTAFIAKKKINKEENFLIKPRTYMNNSGHCLKKVLANYKVLLQDILIVYDDVDLALGKIRFRLKGSCAGHRGMSSIINALGTEEVNRLRIGVGKPESGELSDYVLSDFSSSEQELLKDILARSALACMDWISRGPEYVMQKYNKKRIGG